MSLVSYAASIKDSLVNFVTGLGTAKDPRRSTHYHESFLDRNVLEIMYRSDWLARKIVDAPAEDATREWRTWLAEKADVAKIEKLEKSLQIQRKTREALIRARLYGGGAMVLGVDQGQPDEELDLTAIQKDSLKFVVVLNRWELNAGPRIYNVDSPYYTRPEYYTVATPMFGFFGETGGAYPNSIGPNGMTYQYPQGQAPPARSPNDPLPKSYAGGRTQEVNRLASYASPGMVAIHPSRVVEFCGNELPDWRLAPIGGNWGDPVLQTVEDSLKDFQMIIAGLASMINDMKMDVVKIPELSRKLSTAENSSKLLQRFTLANQAKSTINTLLLDKEEDWERITTQFGSTPGLIEIAMQVACAAGGIPLSRAMGSAPNKGLDSKGGSGGEIDIRNYYDVVSSDQITKYKPKMTSLDISLACSALGPKGIDVDYNWNPLYKPTAAEEAQNALVKAQATQVYVGSGLINEDALRQGVVNQLIEDDVYPGLDDAIDEFGAEPEEEPPPEPPPTPPTGFLPKGQFEPNPFAMLKAQKGGPLPPDKPPQKQIAKDAVEDEPRDDRGQWTSGGGGGEEKPTLAGGKLSGMPHAKYHGGDPRLPEGHTYHQAPSGNWHVANPDGDSLGFGKTKRDAVESAKQNYKRFAAKQKKVEARDFDPDEPRDETGKWTGGGGELTSEGDHDQTFRLSHESLIPGTGVSKGFSVVRASSMENAAKQLMAERGISHISIKSRSMSAEKPASQARPVDQLFELHPGAKEEAEKRHVELTAAKEKESAAAMKTAERAAAKVAGAPDVAGMKGKEIAKEASEHGGHLAKLQEEFVKRGMEHASGWGMRPEFFSLHEGKPGIAAAKTIKGRLDALKAEAVLRGGSGKMKSPKFANKTRAG
jgi:phage-related protein (TIGR01555 family)